MTVKEAILKSLEELDGAFNHQTICQHIISKKYYNFKEAKTPAATVSAQLGDFIRSGDSRVKRVKQEGGTYVYYLTTKEQKIGIDIINATTGYKPEKKVDKSKSYEERDLHRLLSSYLKNTGIYSKNDFSRNLNFWKR